MRTSQRRKSGGGWGLALVMRTIAIVAFLLCGSGLAQAALPLAQYVESGFTTADGLPQSSIKSIYQTHEGYLWLATQEGLVRYDGERFTTFTTRGNPGLVSNNIHKVLEDADNNLWIHASFGVSLLRNGVFQDITPRVGDGSMNRVHNIFRGLDGRMYVHTDTRFYRWEQGRLVEIINFTDHSGITGWPEPEYEVTPSGDLYLSQMCRIYRVRGDQTSELEALSAGSSGSMAYSHGKIWVGGKGLYTITDDGKLIDVTPKEFASQSIGQIVAALDGDLWMQIGSDLCRLRPSETGVRTIGRYPVGAMNLYLSKDQSGNVWGWSQWQAKKTVVECGPNGPDFCATKSATPAEWRATPILRDREGVVWIGTRDGLQRRRPLLNHTLYSGVQLPGAEVNCVLVDHRGETWVGTTGAGLGRLDHDKWTPAAPSLLRQGTIDSMCEDGRGGLWVGVSGRLYHWDFASKVQDVTPQFALCLAKPATASLGVVRSIQQDGHGGVWVAGLDIFHYDGRNVKRFGLTDPAFGSGGFSICGDGADGVWVSGGLGVGHISGGTLQWFGADRGLPSVPIIDILREDDGALWMGTWGAGIVRYAHGKFRTINATDGLYADSIHKILKDPDGTLYINSSKGVFTVNDEEMRRYADGLGRTFICTPIGAADGVDAGAGAAATSPAGVRAPDGGYLFPGEHGLAHVIPQQASLVQQPLVIEDALLNGAPTPTNQSAAKSPGEGSAKFRFACLSYMHSGGFRYWYRLDGFDKNWTEAVDDHGVRYTNLPPGRYTFRVIVREGANPPIIGSAAFTFTLQPHFYEALWFRIVTGLLIICLPVAGMAMRSRRLRRANQILEAKVAERTRAVEQVHQELRAMHAEVVAKNEAMQNVQTEMEAQNEELVRAQILLEKQNARLETLATTDGLTGLTNHRTFQERLELEWRRAGRHGAPLAMILLDVDHFKQYNDVFGHPEGDVVLKTVAEVLRSQGRSTDTVARYGGEEFALILPETDQLAAFHMAERIREAIEKQEWPLRPITISLGVSAVRMDIYAPVDLVTRADAALYESKHRGRNRTTMSTSTKHQEAAR
ncbi:GGDEF domain-containing protein [Capsulimonas corticalis]|uniref:GGDEF domain-containing protein n=1 Tax=Capsulimonas corticalis TaxID=2219043 RepID=A0A402D5C6_9BACT|nr:diguanylate cyclase [Capsulimonas corticalis]BDI29830.1 GGDEF domain-containing protein [Capsulimonas corticalis]